MESLRFKLLLPIMVCILCSDATIGFGSGTKCKEVERNALLKLKHSFHDPDNVLDSWVGEDCCNWIGVGCFNLTGNVLKLDLSTLGYGLFAGEVNSALLELKQLKYLDLSFLDFHGSTIPKFLGSMTQLQHLALSASKFSGEVPQNLGNLTKLVHLDLSGYGCYSNNLEWALKLENLEYLDLSGVNLSQATESLKIVLDKPLLYLRLSSCQLGNLQLATRNLSISSTHLQVLDLSNNYLSGPFPTFLQNLTSIQQLDLSYNKLSSSVPPWLADKTELLYLDLTNNQFDRVDGGIMNILVRLCRLHYFGLSHILVHEEVLESRANISRCAKYNLKGLSLSNNSLTNFHLQIIQNFSSLRSLNLSQNNLENIPPSFGSWFPFLSSLDLSYNLLGVVHQASLTNLSNLWSLHINSNPFFLDVSPNWIPPFQLEELDISSSEFNGPFPKWLLNQTQLTELDLSYTGIFGPLPRNIGNAMRFLNVVRLSNNRINGSLPKSLCDLSDLDILDQRKNALSGEIPDYWENSENLEVVELSSNRLSGPIPNSLTKVPNLQFLSLYNNSLEGELPEFTSSSDFLMILDVGMNNLHGEIPHWNGSNFPSLRFLILEENRLRGMISPQLCSIHTLQVIDLASNYLVGSIPQCFGDFEGMSSGPDLDDYIALPHSSTDSKYTSGISQEQKVILNEWNTIERLKGKRREYTSVLHLLVNMDLSCNNLESVIPTNLTRLSHLIGLNLSHNHFSGAIPKEIGNMRVLESLDLSSNNLSGSIPESISSLNSLSSMNLSFNHLHGQIPTGHQLQVLEDPASIYMGNPGLCGDPLPNKCFGSDIDQPPTSINDDEEEDMHEKMWFYMVIVVGFACGFWGVIGTLIVKTRWRHAYFRFAEEISGWLYVRVALAMVRARGGR